MPKSFNAIASDTGLPTQTTDIIIIFIFVVSKYIKMFWQFWKGKQNLEFEFQYNPDILFMVDIACVSIVFIIYKIIFLEILLKRHIF